jgi:hypothetical protein
MTLACYSVYHWFSCVHIKIRLSSTPRSIEELLGSRRKMAKTTEILSALFYLGISRCRGKSPLSPKRVDKRLTKAVILVTYNKQEVRHCKGSSALIFSYLEIIYNCSGCMEQPDGHCIYHISRHIGGRKRPLYEIGRKNGWRLECHGANWKAFVVDTLTGVYTTENWSDWGAMPFAAVTVSLQVVSELHSPSVMWTV